MEVPNTWQVPKLSIRKLTIVLLTLILGFYIYIHLDIDFIGTRRFGSGISSRIKKHPWWTVSQHRSNMQKYDTYFIFLTFD
jgi:hypothetical protein